METVSELWSRAESWLAAHAPDALALLAPPEDPSIVARHPQLPADYAASLRCHASTDDLDGFLVDKWRLLSLEEAAQDRTRHLSQNPAGFSSEWWPFAADGGGDLLCFDAGGQVVEFLHGMGTGSVVLPSFRAWLAGWVGELEAGRWAWHPEWRSLVPPEELPDREALPAAIERLGWPDGAGILRGVGHDIVERLRRGEKVKISTLGTFTFSDRPPAGHIPYAVRILGFRATRSPAEAGDDRLSQLGAAVLGAVLGAGGRPLEWPGLGEFSTQVEGRFGRTVVGFRFYSYPQSRVQPEAKSASPGSSDPR